MQNKLSRAVQNALEFEEVILPSGLAIRLLAMPSYGSAHVMYTTNFGSINREFSQKGVKTTLPAGVAHFLEHKMFEDENGQDAFTLYANTGASANAYTSFERTSYIFTATSQLERNLDILLSFVGSPYFTEKTIEKEQGIIEQEIKMYEDYPEMRCFYALLNCLFFNHPLKDDIAGTVESIKEITPQMLYNCCDAFYNPSNMAICAAGNLTMQQLLSAAEKAGIAQGEFEETKIIFPKEPEGVAQKEKKFEMAVSMPMFTLGFKEKPVDENSLKTEIICDMITELLAGEASVLYRKLYDEGMVQPGFSAEYGKVHGCLYFMFSGESEKPDEVRSEVLREISRQREQGIDAQQFEICKKMMFGETIADLESVERVASMLNRSYFKGRTPAQELAAVAAISLEDVQKAMNEMMQEEKSAFVVVLPNEG